MNTQKTIKDYLLTENFTIPTHLVESILELDFSSLDNEDKKQVELFISTCQSKYGSIFFTLPNGEYEYLTTFDNIYIDGKERYCTEIQLWY